MKELHRFRQFLTEGNFKNPILDKYLEIKKSIDNKTVFDYELSDFINDLDNTERKGLESDLGLERDELYEGVIEEDMSLEVDDDFIEISAGSGEYDGDLNNDGTVDFSVVYDEFEEGYEEFDDYNWKDVLGPQHAFVQISNKIPTKVEAVGDYVMITVDLEDLKKLLK